MKLVAISQVLFGIDYPCGASHSIIAGLADCGFSEGDLQAFDRDNTLRLLPRFAGERDRTSTRRDL